MEKNFVAEVAVVIVHAGLAPVVGGGQSKAVLLHFIAQAHRPANVPDRVIGILLAKKIVDESRKRLWWRRRGILSDGGRHVAKGQGGGSEREQAMFHTGVVSGFGALLN